MIRALVLLLALVWTGAPVLALSCLQPDPVRDFKAADASDARWGAVVGRLDFDEGRLPAGDLDRQDQAPSETELRAQLVGQSLDVNGWTVPFQGNVTLRVRCFGAWCGQPQSGRRYLVFLKHEDGRRIAFADPCGGKLYRDPAPVVLDRLHSCFAGGPCRDFTPRD